MTSETVTVHYLAKKLGLTSAHSAVILNKSAKPVGKKGLSYLYRKVDIDIVINDYIAKNETPLKEWEWDRRAIAKHFGISLSTIDKIKKFKTFPKPIYKKSITKSTRHAEIWDGREIVKLDYESFFLAHKEEKSKKNPFIYSGMAAEIIMFLKPGIRHKWG